MKHEGRSASTAQGHNGACVNTWEQGCSVVHGSTGQGARGCSKTRVHGCKKGAWVQGRKDESNARQGANRREGEKGGETRQSECLG